MRKSKLCQEIIEVCKYCYVYRKKKYLEVKIYHAFYALEALVKRESSSQICGVCGLIPDVPFGDNIPYISV